MWRFAGIRKFDGHNHRNLSPAEIGQIAGRAGRHMNDGTFGVTGQVPPFESELIDRLENHTFDQVATLQWRSRKLDFNSIEALKESLREMPDHRRLTRSRMVDDVIALENVTLDESVLAAARGPAAVGLLWEMCQIPDYRRVSPANHAELVATLYRFVMSEAGKIPEDWFARQVAQSDRTDGDLDTLSNRLAQIRTWTFVSHRAQWLDDPEHWQNRTRAIEDNLSDALHDRLTQRFVDRRTSVLMRRLRDKEEMMAEISPDGQILVENHYIGRIDGFRFTPDAASDGIDGKAARHAATQVLASELAARAEALANAPDAAIALSPSGRILWQGSEIGKLERGETALKPRFQVFSDEHLAPADLERVETRLQRWLGAHLEERLKPLVALSEASDLSGLTRGLAFRLTENLGVLRRDTAAAEIKALDQSARGQLRKYGIRFGAFNLYFPALLKPASAELLLLLWALHDGQAHGVNPDALPARPQQGLTSVPGRRHASRALLAHRRLPCGGRPRRSHRHARAPLRPHSNPHHLAPRQSRSTRKRLKRGRHAANRSLDRRCFPYRRCCLGRKCCFHRAEPERNRRSCRALGRDGRWRFSRRAGTHVHGRLLRRGVRFHPEGLGIPPRTAPDPRRDQCQPAECWW